MIDPPTLIALVVGAVVAALVVRAITARGERGSLPPLPPGLSGDAAIQALLQRGRKIEAIKIYREQHGVGLKEARQAVERMAREQS